MTDHRNPLDWADDLNVVADKLACIDHSLESAGSSPAALQGAQAILIDLAEGLRALAAEISRTSPSAPGEGEGDADGE